MGRRTIRKGQGVVYAAFGWRECPKCGLIGFFYQYRGRFEIKHNAPIEQAQQLTFGNGLQLLQVRKQKTCYIPKERGAKM